MFVPQCGGDDYSVESLPPDINESIDKFLDTLEYILFFPINYGVHCLELNECQESSFADDQTTSSASFLTFLDVGGKESKCMPKT